MAPRPQWARPLLLGVGICGTFVVHAVTAAQSKPKTMFLYLVAFMLLPTTASYIEDPLKLMQKLSQEYNILSGRASDVLAQLRLISEKSKDFMRLTGPAGNILAAFMQTVLPISRKPEDPLFKALSVFHTHIKQRFEQNSAQIGGVMDRISLSQGMRDYDRDIDVPLYLLSVSFSGATDPKTSRFWVEKLIGLCKLQHKEPLDLLLKIDNAVNIKCKPRMPKKLLPVTSELKTHFEILLERFRDQKYSQSHEDLFTLYLKTYVQFTAFSEEQAIEALAKLEDFFTKVSLDSEVQLSDLNAQLLALLNNHNSVEICLLRDVYFGYKSERKPLLRMAEILQVDTLKLALIGGMCANITYAGDKEKIEYTLEQLALYTKHITGNVSDWIHNELEDAWPDELSRAAKKALGLDQISDPYAYNKTAHIIKDAVSSRGLPGFIYTILVSLDWDPIANFWYRCNPDYCFPVKGFHGINFVVLRHKVGGQQRAEQAEKWFKTQKSAITKTIRDNDKISDLSSLIRKVEDKIGPIISPSLYRSFVILHVSSLTAKACVLNTGMSISEYTGHPGVTFIEVYTHYWWPTSNDERFKLFLFL
uniref:Uncharacterized protein n=1 Tax=Globodera rostochiensis TaxID=31243 RepID=A0A914IEC2_GLORO